MKFFGAINCYTDASLIRMDDGTIATCSGYIVTHNHEIIDEGYEIVTDSTNNYGELRAILLGVRAMLKYKDSSNEFNLFSDSGISIKGLKYWIFSWVRDQDPVKGSWINSSGNYVANQEVFKDIIKTILDNDFHVKLFHQRGHMNTSVYSDLKKVLSSFESANGVIINEDMAREITYFNNLVDENSRNILNEKCSEPSFDIESHRKFIRPVEINLDLKDIGQYASLIGG